VLTFVNKVDRPGRSRWRSWPRSKPSWASTRCRTTGPWAPGRTFPASSTWRADRTVRPSARSTAASRTARSIWLSCPIRGRHPGRRVASALDEVELLTTARALSFDHRAICAGKHVAGVLRQRADELRRRTLPAGFLALCPPPHDRDSDVGRIPAGPAGVRGLRVQDSGQPRPAPSRPDRVRPRLLGTVSARHGGDAPAHGQKLRLRRAHRVFGQERETMDEAFPGDIIGLVNPGRIPPGRHDLRRERRSTSSRCRSFPRSTSRSCAAAIPTAQAVRARRGAVARRGRHSDVQRFASVRREPILAAVGELQFDVVRFRLESEYNGDRDRVAAVQAGALA
jgi:peptide chain release factor 3